MPREFFRYQYMKLLLDLFRRRKRQLISSVLIAVLFVSLLILTFRMNKNVKVEDFEWLRKCRNLSTYIRPGEVTHLKIPSDLSRFKNSNYSFFVVTAPTHKLNRVVIRRTFGKIFKPIFIMGRHENRLITKALMDEADEHDDIILEDFLDTYNNLTLKTAFVLKNFLLYFEKSKFLLKIDDDVFPNHIEIEKILNSGHSTADIIGHGFNDSTPYRNENSKWFLPHWLYQEDFFPFYTSGSAVIIKGLMIFPKTCTLLQFPFLFQAMWLVKC